MPCLPFSVFRRKGRKFFYVQYKSKSGGYLPAVSTKQTSEDAAIETAFKWYREGLPAKKERGNIGISLKDALRGARTSAEAEFICKELKRQGLLKTYVISDTKQAVDFPAYLQNFWDFDNSPYVKERRRKNHGIHKNYTIGQRLSAEKYWTPFFKGRPLGDITRQDLENFMDDLADRRIPDKKNPENKRGLSDSRKNRILKAGTIPLRWAFVKEIIEKDITAGITWFSEKNAERQILSPEIARAIFRVEWPDQRVRLANLLAAVTGLRAGEIQGLRVHDLGKDCLYIRHSWNHRDGLKTPKNNEARTVEVPFSDLMESLFILASKNPHGANMDSYVFWAEKSSKKPMESCLFVDGLREALRKVNMGEQSAKAYVFHGWRHFFTAYMRDKLTDKLLQSQTGHKSLAMLGHYSEHQLAGDREKIQKVKKDVFGGLMISQQPLLPFSSEAVQG
ncbi:MAG: site-specific integrase [Treponema sp.]|nr:site-specific integrase [Treponema sp.]